MGFCWHFESQDLVCNPPLELIHMHTDLLNELIKFHDLSLGLGLSLASSGLSQLNSAVVRVPGVYPLLRAESTSFYLSVGSA